MGLDQNDVHTGMWEKVPIVIFRKYPISVVIESHLVVFGPCNFLLVPMLYIQEHAMLEPILIYF